MQQIIITVIHCTVNNDYKVNKEKIWHKKIGMVFTIPMSRHEKNIILSRFRMFFLYLCLILK